MKSSTHLRGLVGLGILALLCGGESQAHADTIISYAAARRCKVLQHAPSLIQSQAAY